MAKEQSATLFRASKLAKENRKLFSRIVAESYSLTDASISDYPERFRWCWTKQAPGVLDETREIIAACINGRIAGVIFLKKDGAERKICTLYVLDEFREKGLATVLLNEAFAWLGTTRPLITIADYKVGMFEGLIKKHHWRKTQVLDSGYYNNHSKEFVYNGEIET